MSLPPRCDCGFEVDDELLDTLEAIRRLDVTIMPMVALAALVVEAYHAHSIHDVG
jgi:hypothetical protein